jgi:hypothetical protein
MAKHKKYLILYREYLTTGGTSYKADIILGLSKSDAIVQLVNMTDVCTILSVKRIK